MTVYNALVIGAARLARKFYNSMVIMILVIVKSSQVKVYMSIMPIDMPKQPSSPHQQSSCQHR
jgi:hypothetical protein